MRSYRSWGLTLLLLLSLCSGGCKKDTPPSEERAATLEPEEAPVQVGSSDNGPPNVTSVALSPDQPTVRDAIEAKAEASDPDGDHVTFTYQWYVNDTKVLGRIADSFPAGEARHGDTVLVEVVPHDARGQDGSASRSPAAMIRNSPPELREEPRAGLSMDGYQIKVDDPDGDPITFQLEGAPDNMSIDPDGTIRWVSGESDKAGLYKVKMIASDGQGGSVTVVFPAQVNASQ